MIQSHSFKPEPIFFTTDEEKRLNKNINEFYGIELEIIGEDKYTCSYMLDNDSFFYCKNDASIGSKGIEIVSHPASFDFHLKSNKWKKLYDILSETMMYDNTGCGLHFHINKNGFSIDNIATLDFFINNNKEMMEAFGDREFGYYCKRRNKRFHDWGSSVISDHCDAINLTNSETIELRFFLSPTQYNMFLQKLFIVRNIILFVKQTSFIDIAVKNNIKMFVDFLNNNGFEESLYIKTLLKNKNII